MSYALRLFPCQFADSVIMFVSVGQLLHNFNPLACYLTKSLFLRFRSRQLDRSKVIHLTKPESVQPTG
jgi:hypothetical protein